ncbi:type II toxin-antitoxin system VapC family toxin [Aphanothece stagnina]
MVIDTSALIAILKGEPEATVLLRSLSEPGDKLISTATSSKHGSCSIDSLASPGRSL